MTNNIFVKSVTQKLYLLKYTFTTNLSNGYFIFLEIVVLFFQILLQIKLKLVHNVLGNSTLV